MALAGRESVIVIVALRAMKACLGAGRVGSEARRRARCGHGRARGKSFRGCDSVTHAPVALDEEEYD